MKFERNPNLVAYTFKNFVLETLTIDSRSLRNNPLKDPTLRHNPILIPKLPPPKGGWPVIVTLSGFGGNGPASFSAKSSGQNSPQQIDSLVTNKKAPLALYLFVDAMTSWGGSQFLNSPGVGDYENYVMTEIIPLLKRNYPVHSSAQKWCVTGTSSGGYGALHLASKYPQTFGLVAALAPDVDFQICYGSDLLHGARYLQQVGGYKKARLALKKGEMAKQKQFMHIQNALAMAACYSSRSDDNVEYPLDIETGEFNVNVWRRWKEHDPLEFIPKRKGSKKISGVFLEAGLQDEFFLNYGAQKLSRIFKKLRVPIHYAEFTGGHFDMANRRPRVYNWLKKQWK